MEIGENGWNGVRAQLVVEEGNRSGLDCAITQNHRTVVKHVMLMNHQTRNLKNAMKINVQVGNCLLFLEWLYIKIVKLYCIVVKQ